MENQDYFNEQLEVWFEDLDIDQVEITGPGLEINLAANSKDIFKALETAVKGNSRHFLMVVKIEDYTATVIAYASELEAPVQFTLEGMTVCGDETCDGTCNSNYCAAL